MSGSRDGSVKIWDRASGKRLKSLEGHTDPVFSVAISSDGKTIVSGSRDGSVKIWDRASGELLKSLEEHTDTVFSVAISTDGKTIVSGSRDGSVKIWDRASGKRLKSLEGHTGTVASVAISSDGKTIVSSSDDGSVKIWERASWKLLKSLEGHTGTVDSVAISSDGKTIVSGSWDNSVKIWDRASGKLLKSLEGNTSTVGSVAISSDGKTDRTNQTTKQHTVNSVAISSDGKTIVLGSGDKSVKIWDRASGKRFKILEGHTGYVDSVAISKDGKTIVSGSWDNSVKIWDRASGKRLKSLEGHTGYVLSVAISRDGKTIVSGSSDKSVKIWDRASGELLKSLEGHTSYVTSVAISSDGKTIVSGSWDNSVKIWDRASGKLLKELWGGRNGCWQSMDFEAMPPVFYRGDDGTLLYERNGSSLKLAVPKLPREDFVNFLNNNKSLSTINEQVYPYNLTLQNSADTELYWIKTAYHDDYYTLLEQRVSNLKAKTEQNLTLNVNCSLPRENPKPITDHKITLHFTTATKSEFTLPLLVSIRYADINVTKAEVSEDGKNLNIVIQNSGNEDLKNAKIKLLKPFDADTQELALLEVNATKTLSYALPLNENIDKNDTVELTLFIPNIKLEKENPKAEVAPSTVWHIENIAIKLNKWAWYIYALWALGILVLLGLIWYYRRYKNPLVVNLSQTPKELLTLNIEQLKEAKERLSRVDRFENILSQNSVSQERYNNAIAFENLEHEKKADYFAKRIFATVTKLNEQSYMMVLNDDFPLNVKQFILFMSDKERVDDMMEDIKLIPQYRTHIIFVLSNSSERQTEL